MNWAEYILQKPQTLEGRRIEKSVQYRKEKLREYDRNRRATSRAKLKEKST